MRRKRRGDNVGSTCSTLSPSPGTRTGHNQGWILPQYPLVLYLFYALPDFCILCSIRLCLNVVMLYIYLDNHGSCAMWPAAARSTAGFSGWCSAQSEVPCTCTCSPLLSSASNCLKFGSRKLENVPPPNIEIVCPALIRAPDPWVLLGSQGGIHGTMGRMFPDGGSLRHIK